MKYSLTTDRGLLQIQTMFNIRIPADFCVELFQPIEKSLH